MDKELNIDIFGDMMDELLEKRHVQILFDSPKNSNELSIEDNIGLGPAVYFYFLLNALKVTFEDFREILMTDMEESFIDDCLKMVKDEILKGGHDV